MAFSDVDDELRNIIADLIEERDFWRDRAESALEGLRVAMTSLDSFESDLAETRRQLRFSQELLDGAVGAMERING